MKLTEVQWCKDPLQKLSHDPNRSMDVDSFTEAVQQAELHLSSQARWQITCKAPTQSKSKELFLDPKS